MPWFVRRSDSAVNVELSLPIEDWDKLLDEIEGNLEPAPRAVFLPATLPNATPLDLDLCRDGFLVRNLWRMESNLDVIPLFEFLNDRLDVKLARTRQDKLFRLRIAVKVQ